MKYLNDLIQEAKEVQTRFEESKELVLCSNTKDRLEQIVNDGMIKKYDAAILKIVDLVRFLKELKNCRGEDKIIGLMIRAKGMNNLQLTIKKPPRRTSPHGMRSNG